MNLFDFIMGAPKTWPAPVARAAQAVAEAHVGFERGQTPAARQPHPLDLAHEAYLDARMAGLASRAAFGRALEAIAFADDFGALDVSGPPRNRERLSRKARRRAQRILLALADRAAEEPS